jgi:hypothetical protein
MALAAIFLFNINSYAQTLPNTNSYTQDDKWICENVKTSACTKYCYLKQKNEFSSSNPEHISLSMDCASDYAAKIK